ncbi:hypothetical protein FQN53_002443 [Emmonsiellopsis sp. PD_33]|nr:hypothetical protein FQN53_002443 [Emmonsiellopsis sp. PD_33]
MTWMQYLSMALPALIYNNTKARNVDAGHILVGFGVAPTRKIIRSQASLFAVQTMVFKVVFLGDEGVGKTSLAKWCQYGNLFAEHQDLGQYGYKLNTTRGLLEFAILDIPKPPTVTSAKGKLPEDSIDAAVIIFDWQNPASYDSVPSWWETLPESIKSRTDGEPCPVILCGNKVDLPNRRFGPSRIRFHRENRLRYFDISVKQEVNLAKVFLHIARRVLNEQSLEMADDPNPQSFGLEIPPDSQHNDNGLTPGSPAHIQESPAIQQELNLSSLRISTLNPDSEPFTLQNLRPRIESMISRLRQIPEITIEAAEIAPPTPDSEIEQARSFANGSLPTGVEEFYRQIGAVNLHWKYNLPENDPRHIVGHIDILPITRVFGDNWQYVTWFPLPEHVVPNVDDEWRFRFRNVLPFDFFVPEACMCFLQEGVAGDGGGKQADFVAFHRFGMAVHGTRYTFVEYVERLLKSYGFFYWMEALCGGCEGSHQVEEFRKVMGGIYGGDNEEIFCP